jgi:hypothetical protein
MDSQKLRIIRDAAADVEFQITTGLQELMGRPFESLSELEALGRRA